LKDISLTIPCKQIVGIIGATGSGKTTLVDIISGVLDPQKGSLEVDNKIIGKKNIKSWQQLIGYVPQKIYLSDTTISNNIAFGVDRKNINQEAVERAAKIANLHEFIINELPEKYETTVGERGIRLSGGQCQRIGIARAVYNNPQLLIFDEATSALDNMTEHVILEAIKNLRNKITIILIAHRLNTVKNCNTIFLLEKGKLVLQGKYDDLKRQNKIFL
ncbi:MAG: ATP-binding cassette domain-containing protein, partial [Flavobacteriia bacterium]|nr:ATP-binding cassette domain-containing protein [Flavobacteriia bacterium]